MTYSLPQPWQQDKIIQHSQHLLASFEHWLGYSLIDRSGSPEEVAHLLFEAPFVIVSHDSQPDPIFNYGNQKALELWEVTWDQLLQMPSRQTAEEMEQEERALLLKETQEKGFVQNYTGIRISSTKRRFQIQNGIIWNVMDDQQNYLGQAALCPRYQYL
ncbi:MEKHLA domain-containing protein [Spirulina sp. CS-785/01]|uniref:MEKHLA domain-containing protein n=1 Tax=Spirulina sp. CS-785/01 TaxID=3021716 RepID=UPI00233040DB|nr:MEKHLA domain-containing protein [Spirulina sp. CS-785/01]MDB9315478.1 MEKHLA domain-containing protein [Spirulina sp. CS-785/01]